MNENNRKRVAEKSTNERPSRVGRLFQDEEQRVQERAEKGYMPFRFWLSQGEECEITMLDESLDAAFARPEHNLKGADGKYGNIVPCIRNEAECPVCKTDRESTLVLYLSVLVHRPYVSKKTGDKKEYSKMFLCLKRGQYADFARIEKAALKKYNTLRGVVLLLARDNEKNSYGTGMPIPGEEGNLIIDFYKESDLIKNFGHKAIKNREGNKVIRPENDDITPYDYKALMPQPDIDQFMEDFGNGGSAPGSRKALADIKEDEDDSPKTQRRRAPARHKAVNEDDDDESDSADDEADEEVDEPKPSRRGRSTATPARPSQARKPVKKDDEEDEDEIPFD